ncbi:MAG: SDR family NAD(P)-dependent oxidoreductase [Bacteroidetes bacterium]|nr:SDR family NAD(P)-dependent oxidoreductase [Bacteroidota bacterium]
MDLKSEKILVTGADGFIGSHLTEYLIDNGYTVKAFVYYNSFNSWGWLDTLPEAKKQKLEVFAGDIRDPNGVFTAMEDCTVVFHLAALIAIPYSYHSPDSYVDTNVKGTLNVLQAARRLGVKRILSTSTSEVYGTAQFVPITETHPKQGQSPYSATKIGADALADSYFRSFQLPVVIVRPFNTYGPRQSARAVIPTIISQLLNGATDLKLGDTRPTRDLVFVKDTAEGFLRIAETDSLIGHEVNIATGSEISIGDLAGLLQDLTGTKASLVQDEQRIRPENSEVFRLLGSADKLAQHTGWKPGTDLRTGLEQTVQWFSNPENLKQYKHGIYNL